MSADAIVALEAVLGFLRLGQVDMAEAYCESALAAFRAAPAPVAMPAADPSSPDLPPNGSDPRRERSRAKTAERMRKLRAKRRNGSDSVTRDAGDAVTDPPSPASPASPSSVTSVTSFSLSRSPSFSRSLFLSESLEREEGRAREGNSVTRDAEVTPVTPSRASVTGDAIERHASKLTHRAERPPSSEIDPVALDAWCVARGLDPAHPSMARFLDIRRNAKPVTDWRACWRIFLEDEATGRFEQKSGVRRATAQTDPQGQRAWKVGR